MTKPTKCPNCGAQVPPTRRGSLEICPYCGTALTDNPSDEPQGENAEKLGYIPDPPPAYSEHVEPEIVEVKKPVEKIIINGNPVDVSPEVVSTVIQAGRNISRYFIAGIAIIIGICSLCFAFGLIGNR